MPFLVQVASNSASDSGSVTATFGSNVTAGNGVVVAAQSLSTATANLGSGTDTATSLATGASSLTFFYVLSSNGGYKTVNISTSGSSDGIALYAYECSPLASVDVHTGQGNGVQTAWDSGSISTNFVNEFILGAGAYQDADSSSSLTGPSSPWTNETSIAFQWTAGGPQYQRLISGYQIATSKGSFDYSGSGTSTGPFASAAIAGFMFVQQPSLPNGTLLTRQAIKRAAHF